jgi:hypothetical protein
MNQDFIDLLRALSDAEARFLIVGAYALAVHGHPRATGDLDVLVEPTPENAPKVLRALAAFGAPLDQLGEEDFARPGIIVQIGLAPRRIDILTELTGVSFGEAWAGRVRHPFGPIETDYIGRGAFIRNKRAAGRPQDLADIASLGAD